MQTKLGTYTSRKIEQEMCAAAAGMRDWNCDNTSVQIGTNAANGAPTARVYLHGNHIASVTQVRHDELSLQVMSGVLADWPTNTTISRLRALGADVRVDRRKVYLNGVLIATR